MLLFWSPLRLLACACVLVSLPARSPVSARAILVEPPHRSSLWRFNYNTTVNYQDDNLNCGGYDWQWGVSGGRCGICGDIYNGSQDNDDFGKFASGIVVRKYKDGHYVNITFEVSSNYLGYVEFRLCPRNSTDVKLNQSCFDRYPLWIDESHGTRYYIGSRGGVYDIHVRLPGGIVCKKCVLQWKYKTGYRYNGEERCQCLGCGRQEQYINCADIEVYPREGWDTETTRRPARPAPRVRPVAIRPVIQQMVQIDETSSETKLRLFPTTSRASTKASGDFSHGQVTMATSTASFASEYSASVSLIDSFAPDKSIDSTFNLITTTELSPSYTPLNTGIKTSSLATPTINTNVHMLTTSSIPSAVTRSSELTSSTRLTRPAPTTARRKPEPILPGRQTGRVPRPVFQELTEQVTDRKQPQRPVQLTSSVENTQFVSVSNILHRFYPEYIPPYMFPPMLLPNPLQRQNAVRRNNQPRRGLPAGCDVTSDDFRCVPRGIYNKSPGISKWCEINCKASHCVSFMCECFCDDSPKPTKSKCHAISEFAGVDGMDQWCTANCKLGYCPPNTCSVEDCRNDTQSNGEA